MIFRLNDLLAILLSLSCSCCCSSFLCSSDSTNCAAVLILKREIFNCQSEIYHHFSALRSQNDFRIIHNSCQELKNQIKKTMTFQGVSTDIFFFLPLKIIYLPSSKPMWKLLKMFFSTAQKLLLFITATRHSRYHGRNEITFQPESKFTAISD